MCALSIEIKKGTFPLFNKATVRIGKTYVTITSGEVKIIEVENYGKLDIEVTSHWVTCKKVLEIDKNTRAIDINYTLPNWYFFLGAFVLIPLSILALLGAIKPLYLNIPLFIFYLPLMYIGFLKPNKYYKITTR